MNQQLLSEIGRTQRLEILNTLKRTKGLSVNELVTRMKMSYMGIKQHCLTLERDGYLDTWRRPQKMGRPEMVYRLTRRTHDLFEGVLGTEVRREETRTSGLYECAFYFAV